jgi:hypothetical protein
MARLTLNVVLILAVIAAALAPSVMARVQTQGPRFEYLVVNSFQAPAPGVPYGYRIAGYRACMAASAGWNCREFPSAATDSNDTFGPTLETLGNEGWELVSVIPPADEDRMRPVSGTYLFKRTRP